MITQRGEYVKDKTRDIELEKNKIYPCPICNSYDHLNLWMETENIGGQSPKSVYIAHIHCLNCHIEMTHYQNEVANEMDLGGGITFGIVSDSENKEIAIKRLYEKWNDTHLKRS